MVFSRNEFNQRIFTFNDKKAVVFRLGNPTKTFKRLVKKSVKAGNTIVLPGTLGQRFIVNVKTGNLLKNNKANQTKNLKLTVDKDIVKFKTQKIPIEIDLDQVDISKILSHILKRLTGEKVALQIGNSFYTLSSENIRKVNKIIKKELVNIEEQMGSDEEMAVRINQLKKITLIPFTGNNKPNGAFFNHYHLLEKLDLTRYGIFRNYQEANNNNCFNENCFIKTMRMYFENNQTENSDAILQDIKLSIVNSQMTRISIKKIAEKHNLRFTIRQPLPTGRDKQLHYGNKNSNHNIRVGLINEHYFIDEKTKNTIYSIKNYEDVKDKKEWNLVVEKSGKRKKDRECNSYDLIKYLWLKNKEKSFTPIPFNELDNYYLKSADDEITLSYDVKSCIKPNEYKEPEEKKDYNIVFFDFETCEKPGATVYDNKTGKYLCYLTNKEDIKNYKSNSDYDVEERRHTPYLCCSLDQNSKKVKSFHGFNCGRKFLESLKSNKENLLIAHNAGYDWRFIMPFVFNIKQITRGHGLLNATCMYKKQNKELVKITIKCSHKMITMPLSKFGKTFQLDQGKDLMPYKLYNYETVKTRFISLKYCLTYFNNDDDKKLFVKNCNKWDCLIDGFVDIILYSQKYCEIDCIVLKQGYNKFRGWILELCDIDINDVMTIASLAHRYLLKNGVYDDVNQLSGIPRAFIQKCVVGGRVMCSDNKKSSKKVKMADYDGVSLYPSSMARMEGYLKGIPKVITDLNPLSLKKYDGYFIKILIKKVKKKYKFPLLSYINDDGIRVWTNEMVGRTMYLDKTLLEDAIEFHGIEFDVLKGYYFDEGRNPKIREVIRHLFNARLQKKKEGNPIQIVYKLIMNSAYGKSILKPIETEEKVINSKDLLKTLSFNYNNVKKAVRIRDSNKSVIKMKKSINEHFNIAQVGVEVLSMSKRIMNEVMCLAEKNKLKISYTDTDSLHIGYNDVSILEKEFENKYNRPLTGKKLGQFHIDFELKGAIGEVHADRSIFLGKKCYIDRLIGVDKNGDKITDYHIRMKGIPNSTLRYTANKKYDGDLIKMYEDLYNGKKVSFDLLEGGKKDNFEFTENYSVCYSKNFRRDLKF